MIQNICVKISENMIYVPFNPNIAYNDINRYNAFSGSLNIDYIDFSFLNLKFDVPISSVNIYSFSINSYDQRHGVGRVQFNYPSIHLIEDFSYHSLMHIADGPIIDISLNDIHINYISQVLNRLIEDEERNTCPISQMIIGTGERYMLCSGCLNCYNEMDLIQWFQNLNGHNRAQTCPTCREPWSDHNVYINIHLS
jgi:hypothetical protein